MKKILIPLLIIFYSTAYSAIIMRPYLQAITPNSCYVIVECSTIDTVTVQYGLTPIYGLSAKTQEIWPTTSVSATYVHKVSLTGLNPNTNYFYRAMQNGVPSPGSSFISALNTPSDFRFTWLADIRTDTATHDQISQLMHTVNSRFSIYGGDLCVSSGYNAFKQEFFRQNELNMISSVPFFLATGNHETWDTNTKAFTKSPMSPSGTDAYYSFDYGDMHVLVINNQVSYLQGSPQYNFAASDLSSSNKKWKIVVSHNPPYCGGGHDEDSNMIIMAQNLFLPNGVDLVISGHSHFYQHNKVNGLDYLIIGSGGAPLVDPVNKSYTIKSIKDFCWAVIDVSNSVFDLKVYNKTNVLLDTIKLYFTPVGVENKSMIADSFLLHDIYPNPFNPNAVIKFELSEKGLVKLSLFDVNGREVSTIFEGEKSAGVHEIILDSSNLSSGVYFVGKNYKNKFQSRKVVLMK